MKDDELTNNINLEKYVKEIPDISLGDIDKYVEENIDIEEIIEKEYKPPKILKTIGFNKFMMGNSMSINIYLSYLHNVITEGVDQECYVKTIKTPNGPVLQISKIFEINRILLKNNIKKFIKEKIIKNKANIKN